MMAPPFESRRRGPAVRERWEWLWLAARNPRASFGLAIVGGFVVLALLAPVLAPGDPNTILASPHEPPSAAHWFGTTGQGQDVLAQTIWGARTSLMIGFSTGFAVIAIGVAVGMTGAYFGGWVDELLSLLTNLFLIIPGLPLAVVLAAYLASGPLTLTVVLVVTGWAWNARVLRGQALSLRGKDFVAAAIVSGESIPRIIFGEILPNMTSLLVSGFIAATVYAIGASVGLEFLGLGNVGRVTWGTNLYWATNNAGMLVGAWWTIVPTGTCVALVGFALALVNSAIDAITNPRLRAQQEANRVLKAHRVPRGRATPVLHTRG
jgi:peptide/nickel transport system permease protein